MRTIKNVDCTGCKVKDCIVVKYCNRSWQKKINNVKTVSSYRKEQTIVKEDTTALGIYIVHSGSVLIVSERKDITKQIIRLANPGDILEHKVNKDMLKSPFTGEAFEDSIICYIPKATFFELLNDDVHLTIHLERFYTNNFIKAEKRLKNVMIMTGQAKVADALLIVACAFNGNVPFSRKELGELTGISTDQVSRELKKFTESGIIEKTGRGRKIVIKDFPRLLDIVKDYDESYAIPKEIKPAKRQKMN